VVAGFGVAVVVVVVLMLRAVGRLREGHHPTICCHLHEREGEEV